MDNVALWGNIDQNLIIDRSNPTNNKHNNTNIKLNEILSKMKETASNIRKYTEIELNDKSIKIMEIIREGENKTPEIRIIQQDIPQPRIEDIQQSDTSTIYEEPQIKQNKRNFRQASPRANTQRYKVINKQSYKSNEQYNSFENQGYINTNKIKEDLNYTLNTMYVASKSLAKTLFNFLKNLKTSTGELITNAYHKYMSYTKVIYELGPDQEYSKEIGRMLKSRESARKTDKEVERVKMLFNGKTQKIGYKEVRYEEAIIEEEVLDIQSKNTQKKYDLGYLVGKKLIENYPIKQREIMIKKYGKKIADEYNYV